MKHFLYALIALGLLASSGANAAAKFWVGGAGTWDTSTTTHWSTSTGGAGGAAVPVTGDSVTFDANSGTGTVTVASAVSGLSLLSLTAANYVAGGTLDGLTNGPINLTFTGTASFSGNIAHTINWSGTFTFTGGVGLTTFDMTNTTGATFNVSGLNFIFSYSGASTSSRSINGGGKSFGSLSQTAVNLASGSPLVISSANTFSSMTVTGAAEILFNANQTISGALTVNGTPSAPVFLTSSILTITVGSASITGAGIRGTIFTGATVNATNSYDLGGNSGVSITPPAGASAIIGGGL